MGHRFHRDFVAARKARFNPPLLEVGSKNYGSTERLRDLYPGAEYVGIDMEAGPGVDLVLDLTLPFEQIDAALKGRRFGGVFCLSVLEHCDQPFRMADNITRLLRPGGVLYVSVPFAWQFHGYPSDYWRFTHEGVRKLFPGLAFDPAEALSWAEARTDVTLTAPADADLGLLGTSGRWHRKRGKWLRGLAADLLQVAGALGPWRWLSRHTYLLRPTMVDMVGVKGG